MELSRVLGAVCSCQLECTVRCECVPHFVSSKAKVAPRWNQPYKPRADSISKWLKCALLDTLYSPQFRHQIWPCASILECRAESACRALEMPHRRIVQVLLASETADRLDLHQTLEPSSACTFRISTHWNASIDFRSLTITVQKSRALSGLMNVAIPTGNPSDLHAKTRLVPQTCCPVWHQRSLPFRRCRRSQDAPSAVGSPRAGEMKDARRGAARELT